MKVALRILVVAAIGLLLLLGAVLLFAGRAARLAVEKGGTRALGVPTTLESASVSPLRGDVSLTGLKVANPPGFDKPAFLVLDHAAIDVKTASLLSDKIEANELLIDGLAITLEEKGGKANYDVILENLKKLQKPGDEKKPEPEPEAKAGKQFVIRTVVLRNLSAEVYLLPIGGPTVVHVPELVLHNVGEDGQTMDAAVAAITQAALAAIVKSGGGLLPPDMLKDLSGGLAGLGKGVLELGGESLKGVGEKAGELIEEAGKGLGDIFKKK